MFPTSSYYLPLVGLVVLYQSLSPLDAGCVRSGLCCYGKNNTCRADGPRINKPDSTTCFCDSNCMTLKDCCTDYQLQCQRVRARVQAVDCVLSGVWSEWSACDVRCGTGVKQRSRKILVEPANGGRPCDTTLEKTTCEGTGCKVARTPEGTEELKETGKILPAKFGTWRKSKVYNPYKDIRKNLFEHYEKTDTEGTIPPYCAKYELTETRPACQNYKIGDWPKKLVKGATLCIECQPTAMKDKLGGRCRGHGLYRKETRWTAAIAPSCHGKWRMLTEHQECQCDPENELSFILV